MKDQTNREAPLNLWKINKASSEASSDMEATAGAMSLEIEGQCPKCQQQMGTAIAMNEEVYYCDNCRVSLPLSSGE